MQPEMRMALGRTCVRVDVCKDTQYFPTRPENVQAEKGLGTQDVCTGVLTRCTGTSTSVLACPSIAYAHAHSTRTHKRTRMRRSASARTGADI
eukprot:2004517-Pleurochrysis_carterae.AAC.1